MSSPNTYPINSRSNEKTHSTNPSYINRTEFFINIFALCILLMGFVGCLKDEKFGHKPRPETQPVILERIERDTIQVESQTCVSLKPNFSDTLNGRNEILTIVQWTY